MAAAVAAGVLVAGVVALLPPRTRDLHVAATDARTVRGAFHVHTRRSDGSGSIDEVAAAARDAGLQFVVLADHGDGTTDPGAPSYREHVLVVPGVEISTSGGHYLALGIGRARYRLAGEPRDVVEDVHRLGGFGIVSHPLSPKPQLAWQAWDVPFDGLEWLNGDTGWRQAGTGALARAVVTYFFRGPETIARLFGSPSGVLARWDRLSPTRRIVAVAAQDAHARLGGQEYGSEHGQSGGISLRLPSYEAAFSTFAVRVHLAAPWSGDAARDFAAWLAALRAGHAYSAIDAFASPAPFTFTGRNADGRTVEAGDAVPSGTDLELEARVPDAPGVSLALIRNGVVVQTGGSSLRARHAAGAGAAAYRIEARLEGHGPLPWIVSNAIYVGVPGAGGADAAPAAPVRASRPIDAMRLDGWHVERDSRSNVRLSVGSAPWGTIGLRLEVALASGRRGGQYGAVVRHLEQGSLSRWTQLRLTAAADAPARISVQIREPRGGQRWVRSIYVDSNPRAMTVPFAEMTAAEEGRPRALRFADIDSLLFVVDTTHTVPGGRVGVWIGDLALESATSNPGPQSR